MSFAPSSQATSDTSNASIFSSFHAYPFDSDTAFLAGLSQIFGHPGTPVTETEVAQKPDLVLSAKCFYYTRKFKTPAPVEPAAYNAWLASSSQNGLQRTDDTDLTPLPPSTTSAATDSSPAHSATAPLQGQVQVQGPAPTNPETPQPASESSQTTDQQPPYPTSFAAIVDLITNNKPIPGIEEVPTTVLELGSSKQDNATRRKKPWEKDDSDSKTDPIVLVDQSAENADQGPGEDSRRGEGLLRLLRPDAVPDSGLVARN